MPLRSQVGVAPLDGQVFVFEVVLHSQILQSFVAPSRSPKGEGFMTEHVYHARGKAVPEHVRCHVGNLNPHVFSFPHPTRGNNVSLPTCVSIK